MIHILYVDDDPALLEICKSYLELKYECTVATASSAARALDIIQSNTIQVIVSDYKMPGTNGIELLRKIRETNKTIPFILFTGKGSEEIAIETFEGGADFYLRKGGALTSQFAELLQKIRAAVAHHLADTQIITINRLYSVLSATNKAIVSIQTKKELLDKICRIDVDSGGLTMVWAGIVNNETHFIEPVAGSGYSEGYPDSILISIDTPLDERGPTETAFHERACYVCNDIECDPSRAHWRKEAIQRGYHSLAAIPFGLNTKNAGVITFYSSQQDFFNDQVIQLLEEQSRDISFAFEHLDREDQRVSAEAELKKSELKYRRLFQTAQDAILILDGDTGEIIDANTFILDMLGYPFDYFIGKQLWELGFLKDKSFTQNAFGQLRSEGYIRYEHLPLETKAGKAINVEFISNLYLVEDKKIIQCNIRDITQRKRAEDALALTRRKLNLMSGITRHDIMNQLTVLLGSLALARESMKEPEGLVHINRAQSAADTIHRQIAFTKEYEDVGIREPVWQRLSLILPSAASQMASNTIAIEKPDDNLEIYADPLLIKVFYNLFENARQYGGTVTRIRVSHHPTVSGLVITVADNGSGISPEDKKHLFERGFGKNTGLGLFLSREILSITGITINETSIEGMGARFEITVPEGTFRFAENL